MTAAATGVAALTKQSVEQYAQYEQLVGGVETLFGRASNQVMKYAEMAYKTSGLSANEYMETVTSFSASLLQSLGGDTTMAAHLADMAIQDMSDNANKMGTDMSAIQNAYNGFAKQNFTMLDNLKLGYGGTKQEMERLLEDATKLSGVKYDISSYADIVKAIHVVQDEMGITGTTAKEASETISGSIGMLKAAWTNLVTGLGDENANFNELINNVVDSAITAGENLIPRIQQVLMGIATLVQRLAPVIADKLPGLVQDILPPLLDAASTLLEAVVKALPGILKVLVDVLPSIIEMIVTTLIDMAPELVDVAVTLILALANGLIEALPLLLEKLPEIITKIVNTLWGHAPEIISAGWRLIGALAEGLVKGIANIVPAIGQIMTAISDGIGSLVDSAAQWGRDMIDNFIGGIKGMWDKAKNAVSDFAGGIKRFLGFSEPEEGPLSDFHTYAPDMVKLFAKGIKDNQSLLDDAINGAFNFRPTIAAGMTGGQEFTVPRAGTIAQAPRNIIIPLYIDGREFARAEVPYIEAEQRRYGVRIATGGVY